LLVAEAMLAVGQPVTVLTEHLALGPAIEPRTLNHYLGRLMRAGVTLLPMTRAVGWRDGVLRLTQLYAGTESTLEASTVIVVQQRVANDSLAQEVEALLPETAAVHVIGDALAPRRMTHAALEGMRIGLAV
jgi:2,4-dienoyl-CoA reductase (NADPH2)